MLWPSPPITQLEYMTFLAAGPTARFVRPSEMEMREFRDASAKFWRELEDVACPRASDDECAQTDLVQVILGKPTPQQLWLDNEVHASDRDQSWRAAAAAREWQPQCQVFGLSSCSVLYCSVAPGHGQGQPAVLPRPPHPVL